MLFHKSVVSFVAAIALASIVTALPQGNVQVNSGKQNNAQDNNTGNDNNTGTQNTQPVVPVCSTGTPTCCDSTTPFTSLSVDYRAALPPLDSNLNQALPVGLNCALPGTQGWYCTPRPSYSI